MQTTLKEAYIGGSGENIEEVDPFDLYLRYFPNTQEDDILVSGSYESGLFVCNKSAPWEFLVVKPKKYRYEDVTIDVNGKAVSITTGDARESHVEVSRLTKFPEGVVNAAALVAPNYIVGDASIGEVLKDGVEEEYRLFDMDGNQMNIQDRELIVGEYEVDTMAAEPVELLERLAQLRLDAHNKFPDALIVSAGTPITGAPQTSKINTNHPKYGEYISGIEFYLLAKGFGPHTEFLVEAMDQVAKANGFESFEDMNIQTGKRLLWPASARHISLGLVHNEEFRADVDHAANLSYILTSQLASIVEMLSASGPYLWGVAPEMTYEGETRKVRDMRYIFRKMMSTTDYPSYPVRNAVQLAADVDNNMNHTDRMDRALHTKIDGEGVEKATEHGMNRGRFTYSPKKEGRIEYTGASNSYMRAGVISACVLNYLSSIALVATAKGMQVADFIAQETPIPVEFLWGFAGETEETVTDYMFKGVDSAKFQELLEKLECIFELIEIPGNKEQKDIALAAFRNMRAKSSTLQELAVTGKGSLGETLLNYSHLSGLEVAKLVHTFEYCEARFVEFIKNDAGLMKKYLMGELGFNFDETWAEDPLFLEQIIPEIIYNYQEA